MGHKVGRLRITAEERRALRTLFNKTVGAMDNATLAPDIAAGILRVKGAKLLDKPDWTGAKAAVRPLIVLKAAKGLSDAEQARDLGVSRTTIRKWRRAYKSEREFALTVKSCIDALRDAPRSGRPKSINPKIERAIMAARAPDATCRLIARRFGVSPSTVYRIWAGHR